MGLRGEGPVGRAGSDGPSGKEVVIRWAWIALFWVMATLAATFYLPSHLPPYDSDIAEAAGNLVPPHADVTRTTEGEGATLTVFQAVVYFSWAGQDGVLLDETLGHADAGGWRREETKRTPWGWQLHLEKDSVFAEMNVFEGRGHESAIIAQRDGHRDTELAPYCGVAGGIVAALAIYLWRKWRKSFEFERPQQPGLG
jgi:hypothetical protein